MLADNSGDGFLHLLRVKQPQQIVPFDEPVVQLDSRLVCPKVAGELHQRQRHPMQAFGHLPKQGLRRLCEASVFQALPQYRHGLIGGQAPAESRFNLRHPGERSHVVAREQNQLRIMVEPAPVLEERPELRVGLRQQRPFGVFDYQPQSPRFAESTEEPCAQRLGLRRTGDTCEYARQRRHGGWLLPGVEHGQPFQPRFRRIAAGHGKRHGSGKKSRFSESGRRDDGDDQWARLTKLDEQRAGFLVASHNLPMRVHQSDNTLGLPSSRLLPDLGDDVGFNLPQMRMHALETSFERGHQPLRLNQRTVLAFPDLSEQLAHQERSHLWVLHHELEVDGEKREPIFDEKF